MTGRMKGITSAVVAIVFFFAFFVANDSRARAQCSPKDRRAIYRMNKEAMALYQSMEFGKTKKKLSKAFIYAKHHDCAFDWIHALTLTNLGILSAGAYHKAKLARRFLMEALRVRPEASIDERLANPTIRKLFTQARKKLRISEKPQPWPELVKPKPKPRGPSAPDRPLLHEPIDEAPRGKPLEVRCRTGSAIQPDKVVVYYRIAGEATYERVVMDHDAKDPYGWKGRIPGRALWKKSVQYYIQALDADGKVLASAGDAMSPNIVAVTGKGGLSEEENPFASGGRHRGGRRKGKKVGLWLQFGPAWGVGLARGQVEVLDEEGGIAVQTGKPYDRIESPGMALGSVGGQIELGYFIRPKLLLSGYGRMGYIAMFTKNVEGAAMSDGWGMLRVRYFFASVAHRWLDFYGGGGLGFGLIRHVVEEQLALGNFKDTDQSMGVLVGAVLGMTIGDRTKTVCGYLESNLLSTFWKSMDLFTFHIDLSMGINFYF